MQYILRIGPWHVGPFDTHIAATVFAERHACDDYVLIPVDDPAEAPGIINQKKASLRLIKGARR